MATDVDVQFFSHLNGLTLGNNWGDLIRLLDKALVTGLDFTQITAASIDTQGDVHITLYSTHNAMLFQVVELTGFAPASFNQKYRIKGVPNTTQLILKPALDIAERSITAIGTGKLASLGYEIIFRDTGDVKRVYRAIDPTAAHPFIRVDESQSGEGGGTYTSTYAKSAMVGLIEDMTSIDDYADTSKLQLPLDTSNFKKNWQIVGAGNSVVRGWSKWYWARAGNAWGAATDAAAPSPGARYFTLCGNKDAFYILNPYSPSSSDARKILYGAGLYNSTSVQDQWFLMALTRSSTASDNFEPDNIQGGTPLTFNTNASQFIATKSTYGSYAHVWCTPILHDFQTGHSAQFNGSNLPALEIPFFDSDKKLRGTLKHVCYCGTTYANKAVTAALIADNSMYVGDGVSLGSPIGFLYFYLGELE
ncbi:hypothetical protein [Acinetobacter radioresistens]|uniref:hypothetical protein n=1 Tax=Acinetobacter radioresistens TaxID=40216 RepID=UPI002002AC61|nr:hypothetical protein [Acinetobacter radioresistens]MCK4077498.1 hypothetical protein [Acinetobacter radioresistens]